MKIQKLTLMSYIVIAFVVIWLIYDYANPNYEKMFKQNSEEFADNRIHFEKLIAKYKHLNDKQNLNELSKTITKKNKDQLDVIGIENIEISFNEDLNCTEKLTFKFVVKSSYNVRKLNSVQIIYSPCNMQTKKGYHSNSYHIDINGEGNNWLIFSDTDFI